MSNERKLFTPKLLSKFCIIISTTALNNGGSGKVGKKSLRHFHTQKKDPNPLHMTDVFYQMTSVFGQTMHVTQFEIDSLLFR